MGKQAGRKEALMMLLSVSSLASKGLGPVQSVSSLLMEVMSTAKLSGQLANYVSWS